MPFINVYCWISIYVLGGWKFQTFKIVECICGHILPLFFPKKFVIVTLSNLYYVRFLNKADQDIFLVFTIYFLLVNFQ